MISLQENTKQCDKFLLFDGALTLFFTGLYKTATSIELDLQDQLLKGPQWTNEPAAARKQIRLITVAAAYSNHFDSTQKW